MKYNKSYLARRLALSLIIGGMFVSSAYALPQGGAVVGGGSNGNIGGSGNVMEITGTGSNNVAIKWEQFNIANGETVNFKNMANVLNYVTGNTKSEIYGALNGQNVNVFLLNPNGILFGKGAAVNVGSLYASTGKMTDAAINGFNGTPAIDLSSVTADVLNLGAIRADAADIKKQNGDAIAAADQANYILKAEGTINVGYETIGTKNISIIENGVSTEHAIRDYSAGAAEQGSTLFTGKKLNGSEANNVNDCMLISDIYELQSIQDNRAGRYMLTKDIDGVATKNWNSGAGFKTLFNDSALKFMGVFDGAGYTISDLYINSSTGKYGGLFGVSAGKIANVQLSGIDYNFTGGIEAIGGIVGYNVGSSGGLAGSVRNVQASGKITASNLTAVFAHIGGIVGTNASTVAGASGTPTPTNAMCIIKDAVSKVDITASGNTNIYAGGIAGNNSYSEVYNETGVIENVKNEGAISVTDSSQAKTGGIVGNNAGQVSKAENTGAVTGTWHVGGILGYSNNSKNTAVINSELHNSGTVTGIGAFSYVGGIVGQVFQGKFDDLSNGGTVTVNATNTGYAGGIIGHNSSTNSSGSFTNLSNSGAITGNVTNAGYAGGIFGENDAALEFEKFNNSGTIKGNGWIGGIIGYNNGGAIKNSYNTGVVAGTGAGTLQLLAGGIVGNNNSGSITNVYNTGAVSADKGTSTKTCFAGGIVAGNKGPIKNAYNMGSVTVENGAIGKGIVAAGNGTITNAFYFDPSTQRYYDYDGAEYTSTEAFNQSFMEGAAASGEQAAWLGYSDGRTTPQLQAFLSPLDVSIGNIEVEITDGDIYTGLAQAIIDKLTAMGVEFDASKIKAVEVKEAGTYDLSSLLYSTQDGYKITIGDGGKLTVTVNAKKPEVPPVDPPIGPSVINDAAYQAALINIQHADDDLRVVQQTLEPEKYAEDEEGRVKIMGTGIKI